jgi:aldehyde dehydrogenase (NAD+)
MHAAGVPAGVFNMVHGAGDPVGQAMSAHPDVDMVSFTGSTRAGIDIARRAAPTVKRVSQELGGKSPNLVLDDADFAAAVAEGVQSVMRNSGQTCTAPTRMLVPAGRMKEAAKIAKETAESIVVGDPNGNSMVGPVVSEVQFNKIQGLIQAGIDEGATLVTGGPGRPEGLERGYYVRPTVFADVDNGMRIAREEIFGPVLSILGFQDEGQALAIANDTDYGLAAYVQSTDHGHALDVAGQLRAGQVRINEAGLDLMAPFGGYKQSGNGREWGVFGFDEFTEVKAVLGGAVPAAAE